MCNSPRTFTFPPSVYDRLIGLQSNRSITVPCGKCMDCLRKRQNDLATRVYREARKKGSAVFVTLTYEPQYIPLASSLWKADKYTGEFELITEPSLIDSTDLCDKYRSDIIEQMRLGRFNSEFGAICLESHVNSFEDWDSEHDYIIRVTPTLYYKHVKDAFKRFRNKCQKDFTYICVGEYGSSPTGFNRPHYHLIFFGLDYKDCELFCQEWKFGFHKTKQVHFVNEDGSDGLARVSRYVGKYCAKGRLDIYTVRQRCTLSDRLRSSKGLGSDLTDSERDYFLAKDVFNYDEFNPYETIPKVLIPQVIDTIISRQFVNINGYKFPLPKGVIHRLYGYTRTDTKKFHSPHCYASKAVLIFEKAIYLSPLFYMVADELRSRAEKKDYQQFKQLFANYDTKDIPSALMAYNHLQETIAEVREHSLAEANLKIYRSTKLKNY